MWTHPSNSPYGVTKTEVTKDSNQCFSRGHSHNPGPFAAQTSWPSRTVRSQIERPRRHPTKGLQTIALAGRPRANPHPCSGARARAMGFALFSQGNSFKKRGPALHLVGSRGARPPGPVPEHGFQHGFPLFTVTYIALAVDSDIAIGVSPVAQILSRIHHLNTLKRFWELHFGLNLLCSGRMQSTVLNLSVLGVTLWWRSCTDLSCVVCVVSKSHYAICGWVLKPTLTLPVKEGGSVSHIHIRMAGRRVTWRRLVVVHSNTLVNDENLSLGWENDEESILRNPVRPQPRIPLRDITHLFPGNVSFWPYHTSLSLQNLIVQWWEWCVSWWRYTIESWIIECWMVWSGGVTNIECWIRWMVNGEKWWCHIQSCWMEDGVHRMVFLASGESKFLGLAFLLLSWTWSWSGVLMTGYVFWR